MQDYETDFPSIEVNAELSAGSSDIAEAMKRIISLETNGEIDKALFSVDAALKQEPRNPSLYYLAARLLFTKQDYDKAFEGIELALSLKPKSAVYLKLRGDIEYQQGLLDNTRSSYLRAMRINGRDVNCLNNLGNVLRQLGALHDATKYLQRAISNRPDFAPAYYNLAIVQVDQEDFTAAATTISSCLEQSPDMTEAWLLQDLIVSNLDESSIEERLALLRDAINARPADVRSMLQLVKILEDEGRFSESLPYYADIQKLDPSIGPKMDRQARVLMNRLQQPLAQRFADMAVKCSDNHYQCHLFMSSYLAVLDLDTCFQNHVAWSDTFCAPRREAGFQHSHNSNHAKLRIGYVSPDFYSHAVSFFIKGVFEHHDKDKFDIYAYANVKKRDGTTEQLQNLVDHWRDIQHLDDYAAAELIKRDEIDILIDLSGHTMNNRVALFAYKPAPVQATYLGYPGSTGLAEMDYWITDHLIHPADSSEPSSEEKYRLNRCYMAYSPPEAAAEIEPTPEDSPVTIGVVNHIGKHSQAFIETWGAILDRMPEARLVVKSIEFSDADLRLKVLDRIESLGIDRQRVTLLGATRSHTEHFQVYNKLDVCLDPFPYTGGTSTCDALIMGTPVVTLTGDSLKSRMSTALLTGAGRTEWICEDLDQYIDVACRVAQERTKLEQKLAIRAAFLASEVTDSADLTHHLESAYGTMWSNYLTEINE